MTPAPRAQNPALRRILVVDDNLDNVRSLDLLFRQMGHHIEYAINATAAIALAQRVEPDIIFLDLLLPDDHGAGVCAELRKDPRLAKTRIIGVTASNRMLDLQLALDAGCDDVLRKPVPPQVYERLIAGGQSRKKIRELVHRHGAGATVDEPAALLREVERLKARAQILLHEHRHTVAALKAAEQRLEATQPVAPLDPSTSSDADGAAPK